MSSEPLRFGDIQQRACIAATHSLGNGLAAAARAAFAVADTVMAEASTQPHVAEAVAGAACAKGCSWCCHQVVGVTAAEEELLAEAIKAMPADARHRLRARQTAAEVRLSQLTVETWQAARVPCPLLEDGACVLHDARPLPCRAVLSADADACRRWREGEEEARIPLVAVQRGVYSHAQAGLAQALGMAGIPAQPVSLVEALSLLGD
jgi:Fe-S-cluster containining protein